MTLAQMTNEERIIVNAAIKSYIKVYGIWKWAELTEQEQHDAIMIMLNDLANRLN